MIIWSDELCSRIVTRMVNGPTYKNLAQELSTELGEYIHPEQLRGAIRRYNERTRVRTHVEERSTDPEPVKPRIIVPLTASEHKSRQRKPMRVRFGAVGDTHLCSNYTDLDALHKMYIIFRDEGIQNVYHTGNWIDGEARFNASDIHVRGMDSQLRYFIDNYPRVNGIHTHYISGDDHEGWYTQNFGIDIGAHLEDMAVRAGRSDLHYLDYMEADVPIVFPNNEEFTLRVMHAGGGSSEAISATSQKIVNGWDTEERPFILLVGHYHKAEYLPNYRGVRVIQTGAFQRQTPFMRKKRLHSDVGGWIVDVSIIDERTTRVSAEFISFSPKPWRYQLGMR